MTYSDPLLDKAVAASAAVPEFWTRLNLDESPEGMFEVGWSPSGVAARETVLLRTTTRAEAMRIRDRLEQRACAAAVLLSVGFQEK